MPRDGSATRGRILDAAEKLFESNGVSATSVEAIIEASGTSKGAFFHHFESKRALSQALVERYVEMDLTMLRAGLDSIADRTDPVERVLGFLRFYERWATELVSADSACLYLAVLTERDLLDDTTSEAVERAIVAWRVEFSALIRAALAARGLRRRINADDVADHLFATFEGGYLLCRSLRSAEPMRRQIRVMRQLLEGYLAAAA